MKSVEVQRHPDNTMHDELLLGNEAIAEGALESSVEVATGYPGTPSSETLQYLSKKVLSEGLQVYVEWSTNEKVAIDTAAATAWAGKRSLVTMKAAGLNVASDTLTNIAYKGVKGGMVVYVADDPGTHAGCTEQDSRYFAFLSSLPILDPSYPAEAKKFTKIAFELSEKFEMPVILRSTTNVAHALGNVPVVETIVTPRAFNFKKELTRYTTILADRMQQHAELLKKIETARHAIDDHGLNPLILKNRSGVVVSGVSWTYLQEAIHTFQLDLSTLKIDCENPWPTEKARSMLSSVDEILVLEEQEPIVETLLKKTAAESGKSVRIIGKEDGTMPRVGEYTFELVASGLSKLIGRELTLSNGSEVAKRGIKPVDMKRTLSFCPGCPHSATYYVINRAIAKARLSRRDVIVTGDIGCTSMGVFKPLETLWTEVTMGASIGLAHGFKVAGAKNIVIATLGDSTFFHAGMPALVNAVAQGSDITIIVLDNGWTAMTGLQPSPTSGRTALGKQATPIDIARVAEAIGAQTVVIDPFEVAKSTEIVANTIKKSGVKVIVSRAECALQSSRIGREKRTKLRVNEGKCKSCGACITTFYCPAILVQDGTYSIDSLSCVGCEVCAQMCPFNAIE